MNRRVVFRAIARHEFDEAVAWYERERPGLGMELMSEIDATLAAIVVQPGIFRVVRGVVRRAVLRRFPYSIHFLVETERIVVLAIFHAARDPEHLPERQ